MYFVCIFVSLVVLRIPVKQFLEDMQIMITHQYLMSSVSRAQPEGLYDICTSLGWQTHHSFRVGTTEIQ